ncbi:CACNA1A, partial [Symbiodinium pilosum]
MAPKVAKNESFLAKQERLKKKQEEEETFQATAEDIEREMAEEINAQAEKSKFKTPAWVNITAALVGVLQLGYRIEQERERRKDDYFANPRPEIYTFVASMSFEVGIAFLIVLNCIILGWQVSLPEENDQAVFFDVTEHIFVGLFLFEWSLRVMAFGWVWIFEFSNMADTVMVFVFGVIPKWVLDPLGIEAGFIRIFTVLRALRLARLARAVRMRPAFKELWILIHGLTTSFRPLFWTLLIAMIVVYLGGLAAAELIGKDSRLQEIPRVQDYFGDLLKSMYTMIQLLTLDTWTDDIARWVIDSRFNASQGLPEEGVFYYCLFFVGFIGIGVFVFWNLITAIIVETAFAISDSDANSQAREMEMEKKAEL